jgi:integrase
MYRGLARYRKATAAAATKQACARAGLGLPLRTTHSTLPIALLAMQAGLSPRAVRRSFASWSVAEGEDAAYVMAQLGHTDPTVTLGLYAKELRSKRRRADRSLTSDNAGLAPSVSQTTAATMT